MLAPRSDRLPPRSCSSVRLLIEKRNLSGCPIALSSDAHVPDQVGFKYDEALELLESLGVKEIAVFEGRERRMEPVG